VLGLGSLEPGGPWSPGGPATECDRNAGDDALRVEAGERWYSGAVGESEAGRKLVTRTAPAHPLRLLPLICACRPCACRPCVRPPHPKITVLFCDVKGFTVSG
jgi:hypothetical protein